MNLCTIRNFPYKEISGNPYIAVTRKVRIEIAGSCCEIVCSKVGFEMSLSIHRIRNHTIVNRIHKYGKEVIVSVYFQCAEFKLVIECLDMVDIIPVASGFYTCILVISDNHSVRNDIDFGWLHGNKVCIRRSVCRILKFQKGDCP